MHYSLAVAGHLDIDNEVLWLHSPSSPTFRSTMDTRHAIEAQNARAGDTVCLIVHFPN